MSNKQYQCRNTNHWGIIASGTNIVHHQRYRPSDKNEIVESNLMLTSFWNSLHQVR